MRATFTKKGSRQEFGRNAMDPRHGNHAFSPGAPSATILGISSVLPYLPCSTRKERRHTVSLSICLGDFDISVLAISACGLGWHFSVFHHMYKQHALVRNLDEQEDELADYIRSIATTSIPQNSSYRYYSTLAHWYANGTTFPLLVRLRGVPAAAGSMRYLHVSWRGEVNANAHG
jgi:hypothetical protein